MIPQPKLGQRGWSVERDGTVHLRYATDHAPAAQRAATVKGVETILDGTKPIPCRICFPHGNKRAPDMLAKRGQRRRTAKT